MFHPAGVSADATRMLAAARPSGWQQCAPAGRSGGDRVRIRLAEQPMVVTGGSFQEMLVVIKGIPGRRFNSQDKVWEFPEDIDLDSVQQAVRAAGFVLKAD